MDSKLLIHRNKIQNYFSDIEVQSVISTRMSDKFLSTRGGMKATERFIISIIILACPLADKSENSKKTYSFMPAYIRKNRWPEMRVRVPSGRGEFRHMEALPETIEMGSHLRGLGEDVK